MDEIDEIRKKKMEEMKRAQSSAAEPKVQYPDKPIQVDDSSLDSSVSQYPLMILDCWAEWCGPCRMLAPVIEDLAREFSGRIVFGKLNVDQNPQTSSKYRVSAIPTLLVFKNGKLVDKLVGAYPKASLSAKIQKYL